MLEKRILAAGDVFDCLEMWRKGSRLEPNGHYTHRISDVAERNVVKKVIDEQNRLENVSHPMSIGVIFEYLGSCTALVAAQ